MRLIIAGSRKFPEAYAYRCLTAWEPFIRRASVVLSGQAAGPDTFGERIAEMWGIPVERHPALWRTEGRAAGILRNNRMVARADALLALYDGHSAGTGHIIEAASAANLTVVVLGPGGLDDSCANPCALRPNLGRAGR